MKLIIIGLFDSILFEVKLNFGKINLTVQLKSIQIGYIYKLQKYASHNVWGLFINTCVL